MKRNITLVVLSIGVALLLGACSKLAQVTNHKNCDPSLLHPSLNPTVPIFSEADSTSVVKERIAPGSVVRVYDYRNHQANPKPFVRVKTEKVEGWMNPRCLVVGQDPEKSVFTWGYRKDYAYFYSPDDHEHYPNGYEFKDYASLPKEKVPLAELAPELKK
ncbi:E-cadherin-binding lipoprotein adhesin Lsa16 [Leptospira noguchii]|uniref:E-cadherin-binding lipoprotein adhesin Lsa16 n=1 Tax=Leptospira noguchii TaxID=28182 RepID=UPI0002BFF54F|nr:hypothetical protein [Leptospira noguchii]EMI72621.1 putative lipoprotein [Leptospira noguchii str. Bonito]UOG29690.1 hypothetical protein MAL06_13695 [Leptospira noguchii]UOG34985.1 hypothetical protein MAL02_04450 [Leptospira noguchii]UOG45889.1 hypothetical protein MAL01_04570 [Leptospira noguchii]